jgi:hypothetical protein
MTARQRHKGENLMTTDRRTVTLARRDNGKTADAYMRARAAFIEADPEGWEGYLALAEERGGSSLRLSLLEDGTVEFIVAGMVIGRVPFAMIERDEPGAPRRMLH